jgi:hypothetical protein
MRVSTSETTHKHYFVGSGDHFEVSPQPFNVCSIRSTDVKISSNAGTSLKIMAVVLV